ncbi:hypothetical protein [Actinomyces vulturis]|uniref:hypothetical protein n=1 Tax=Actinomyces vulturis TaxID=1857645 RepID=UPI00083634E0|nr:hypothetical protein [Actinomyces vulturis]
MSPHRSGNPAKAAQQEREERLARQNKRTPKRRLPKFPFAFAAWPKWLQGVAIFGLVTALFTTSWALYMSLTLPVGAFAWVLMVVALFFTVSALVGTFTDRPTWVISGLILAAAAPTLNFYVANVACLVCGLILAMNLNKYQYL